ncbi:MAG: hypothetical protein ACM3NN_15690 [Nitrospirota bacterium]|jgi:hypothetical protein
MLVHLDYVSRLLAASDNTSENTLVTQAHACVFSADAAVISAL